MQEKNQLKNPHMKSKFKVRNKSLEAILESLHGDVFYQLLPGSVCDSYSTFTSLTHFDTDITQRPAPLIPLPSRH